MGVRKGVLSGRVDRRDALRLLALSAGGGIAALYRDDDVFAGIFQRDASRSTQPWPRGAIIRTLLQDVPPDSLNVILFHEHLNYAQWYLVKIRGDQPMPDGSFHLENLDLMVDEAKAALKDGVTCIVDGGHRDMGRQIPFLRELSARSGMPIVAGGGYYMQAVYPPEISRMSEDEIVEQLVRDANAERWGALGEIGSSDALTADERKVMRAVGKAHLRTNLPIFTHTQQGRAAEDQLDVLQAVGVDPRRVVIGHLGNLEDPAIKVHKTIAALGAGVGFDRVGSPNNDKQVAMVVAMIDAGFADNVFLSGDQGSAGNNLKAKGGPGYAKPWTVFVPMLRKAGVKEDIVQKIIVDNPRRFLAFVPKKS